MARSSRSPGAVAVVRLWFEPDNTGSAFRARVTYNSDPDGPARSVVLTDPADVLATLSDWFEVQRVADRARAGPDPAAGDTPASDPE